MLGSPTTDHETGHSLRPGGASIVVAIVLVIPPFAASLIEKWSERDVESRSLLAYNGALDELTNQLDDHELRADHRPV